MPHSCWRSRDPHLHVHCHTAAEPTLPVLPARVMRTSRRQLFQPSAKGIVPAFFVLVLDGRLMRWDKPELANIPRAQIRRG